MQAGPLENSSICKCNTFFKEHKHTNNSDEKKVKYSEPHCQVNTRKYKCIESELKM